MIGAEPNTGWLFGTLLLDKKGFIITGTDEAFERSRYATSAPGIFAIGDVRSTSVKRVASAVGEGSIVISDVHRFLAERRMAAEKRRTAEDRRHDEAFYEEIAGQEEIYLEEIEEELRVDLMR